MYIDGSSILLSIILALQRHSGVSCHCRSKKHHYAYTRLRTSYTIPFTSTKPIDQSIIELLPVFLFSVTTSHISNGKRGDIDVDWHSVNDIIVWVSYDAMKYLRLESDSNN